MGKQIIWGGWFWLSFIGLEWELKTPPTSPHERQSLRQRTFCINLHMLQERSPKPQDAPDPSRVHAHIGNQKKRAPSSVSHTHWSILQQCMCVVCVHHKHHVRVHCMVAWYITLVCVNWLAADRTNGWWSCAGCTQTHTSRMLTNLNFHPHTNEERNSQSYRVCIRNVYYIHYMLRACGCRFNICHIKWIPCRMRSRVCLCVCVSVCYRTLALDIMQNYWGFSGQIGGVILENVTSLNRVWRVLWSVCVNNEY